MLKQLLAIICLSAALSTAASAGQDDVLILVNENMPPETGTEGIGASAFVGEHYARSRDIPLSNILRLRTYTGEAISWDEFEKEIAGPLRTYLERSKKKDSINYIVPVYGMPYKLHNAAVAAPQGHPKSGYSLDLFLSSLYSFSNDLAAYNPYYAGNYKQRKLPFRLWSNPLNWKMYLVTRLDGPSAEIAKGLVDKAIAAETSLKKTSGIVYIDYRNLRCPPEEAGYCDADASMLISSRLSEANGFKTIFNDQSRSGGMITQAPKTLFAWGWYSENKITGDYSFVPGAVGAQLTSFTANRLRTIDKGTWVPRWLTDGVTATWGASEEPYTHGYANGDILFANFWTGSNFADSAYLALPKLNWMMVFVGDPLYAPQVFRSEDKAPPRISGISTDARVDFTTTPFLPPRASAEITWITDEPADSLVEYARDGEAVQRSSHGAGLLTRHIVSLLRLEPGAKYRLRLNSRDRAGNLAVSETIEVEMPAVEETPQ